MKKGILVLIALFVFVGYAQADMAKINEKANSDDYATKAPAMLVRGVSEVVLSPGELVKSTYKHTKEGKPVIGTLKGVGHGTHHMVDRGGRGIVDAAFFWAPKFNGFPKK